MKRYLWTYSLGEIQNGDLQLFSKTITEKLGITDLFVSMNNRLELVPENFKVIAEIVDYFSPINIHAMLFEDPNYSFLTNKNKKKIRGKLEIINKYNETYPEHQLKGIHVDIEPHALPEYHNIKLNVAKQRELFHCYRNAISFIDEEITKIFPIRQNILFSAAVGWWYETLQYASSLYLVEYLDEIIPMIYNTVESHIGNSLDKIRNRSFSELDKYYTKDVHFVIGIGIYEFSNYSSLMNTIEEIEMFFSKKHHIHFNGISIYSDKQLKIL